MRADRASEMSVCLSLRLFVHPSSCLIFSQSVCLSVCLGVRPFVRPSVRPCLSPSLPRRVRHRVTTFQTNGSCPSNRPCIQSRVRPTTTLSDERTEPMSDYATVAPILIMLARFGLIWNCATWKKMHAQVYQKIHTWFLDAIWYRTFLSKLMYLIQDFTLAQSSSDHRDELALPIAIVKFKI